MVLLTYIHAFDMFIASVLSIIATEKAMVGRRSQNQSVQFTSDKGVYS